MNKKLFIQYYIKDNEKRKNNNINNRLYLMNFFIFILYMNILLFSLYQTFFFI